MSWLSIRTEILEIMCMIKMSIKRVHNLPNFCQKYFILLHTCTYLLFFACLHYNCTQHSNHTTQAVNWLWTFFYFFFDTIYPSQSFTHIIHNFISKKYPKPAIYPFPVSPLKSFIANKTNTGSKSITRSACFKQKFEILLCLLESEKIIIYRDILCAAFFISYSSLNVSYLQCVVHLSFRILRVL